MSSKAAVAIKARLATCCLVLICFGCGSNATSPPGDAGTDTVAKLAKQPVVNLPTDQEVYPTDTPKAAAQFGSTSESGSTNEPESTNGSTIAANSQTEQKQSKANKANQTTSAGMANMPGGSGGPAMGSMGMGAMNIPAPADMVFKDDVQTNVEMPRGLDGLIFVDTNNKRVQLSDYLQKKHVVLVFTEGFSGMLCPFCKTQTSRLVRNYNKFEKLNAEILVVYPGERDHIDEFIIAARTVDKKQLAAVPFPVVLDPKLEAVDHFDIRSKLAHPSTYVIDKNGKVQLAYVGKDMSADRPSIKALLETLERVEARN